MDSNLDRVTALLRDKFAVAVAINRVNADSRDDEGLLFPIAHLFGHMVQFTRYRDYAHLVDTVEGPKPPALSEGFRREFYAYGFEAYRLGKALLTAALGEAVFGAMDERYQISLDTDFAIFWDYLTTGRQMATRDFNGRLAQNYRRWAGRYPHPLEAKRLPDAVSSQKGAVVYQAPGRCARAHAKKS
jgi:hypothetical protein